MELLSTSRPKFEVDGVVPPVDPVRSSLSALVRFEFEAGRGNEGTKILMVEWEEEEENASSPGDWQVSWEGKTAVLLSAREGTEDRLHRIYFLLGPGTSIPPVIRLAREGAETETALEVKPLPAIFPAELGLRGTAAGRRGILHTRYAKQRLAALEREIEGEMRTNGEGIGLEIAVQERQWLEESFGVGPRAVDALPLLQHPASPKTPGGGRLAERLKGLKLGTSASELGGSSRDHGTSTSSSHPLSPDAGDVAVSSFSLFHSTAPRRIIAQNPPDYLVAQQRGTGSSNRIASLDEVTGGPGSSTPQARRDDDGNGDELFAVKLSPRSPDMAKSPFSFSATEAAPLQRASDA